MIYSDKRRVFHCYQRPKNRGLIFYSFIDHLLYFTIFCSRVRNFGVTVLKLVQMPDHLHHSLEEKAPGQVPAFIGDVTRLFCREYNRGYGISGPMFDAPFGRALKVTDKDIRSNMLYLDNNPTERQLVKNAEDYRWNYLAYAASKHPFSEKIVLRKASMPLRRALKMVKFQHDRGKYLSLAMLRFLFKNISTNQEQEQLIDYIISTYSVINYAASCTFFKSYQDELIAAHSVSGKEYDITESFIGRSDRYYAIMERTLLLCGKVKDIHEILTMPIEKKRQLYSFLRLKTDAPRKQIAIFLHIPLETV